MCVPMRPAELRWSSVAVGPRLLRKAPPGYLDPELQPTDCLRAAASGHIAPTSHRYPFADCRMAALLSKLMARTNRGLAPRHKRQIRPKPRSPPGRIVIMGVRASRRLRSLAKGSPGAQVRPSRHWPRVSPARRWAKQADPLRLAAIACIAVCLRLKPGKQALQAAVHAPVCNPRGDSSSRLTW